MSSSCGILAGLVQTLVESVTPPIGYLSDVMDYLPSIIQSVQGYNTY